VTEPDAVLVGNRFLHDISAMLLWGTYAYLAFLVPRKLAFATGRQLRAVKVISVFVAVLTTVMALPIEAAAIGDGWQDAVSTQTLTDLLDTDIGTAWSVQVVVACALLFTLWPGRETTKGTALIAGALLVCNALSGHAAMRAGLLRLLQAANDAIHLLAAGAWLGALVPLALILRHLLDPPERGAAMTALWRFSGTGRAVVVTVILTGLVNTMLVLGHLPTDWTSPYEGLLALKIALVAALVGLAIANRYRLMPRLGAQMGSTQYLLVWSIALEVLFGLLIVGLVSTFGTLEPS
jgi:copper resistance protein D